MWWRPLSVAAVLALPAVPLSAQEIAARVAAVRDGQVRMSFAAREGVCGHGRHITTSRDTDDWERWCEEGPVRVALDVVDGEVVDVDAYVGGRWRAPSSSTTDLGMVSAPAAAAYLLSLARRADGRAGKAAVFPATLADSVVVWPDLLAIAKDETRPRATRKSAVFWVAQAAGAAAVQGLEEIVDADTADRDIKKSAVFALSQRNTGGVPALIRIATTHRDPAIRKQAIFWLGQSDDPRAVELFERLLLRP